MTAALIDSRDSLAARGRAEAQLLLPEGPKVAVTGGAEFNDHRLIWARLDRVHAKHPDMVLLHGGSPKGAELIASRWADHHEVPDLPREAPSFITRVCGSVFHILRRWFGQARRARSPQVAQASDALLRVFGCRAMNVA